MEQREQLQLLSTNELWSLREDVDGNLATITPWRRDVQQ